MTIDVQPLQSARRVPWKNGRGMTLELASDGTAETPWTWRLSIADVPDSGPFSRFDGCTRHIACLEGDGMRLMAAGAEREVPGEGDGFVFSGDVDAAGILVGGACRDANLIHRRDCWSGRLRLLRGANSVISDAHIAVAHAISGELTIGTESIGPQPLGLRSTAIVHGESVIVRVNGVAIVAELWAVGGEGAGGFGNTALRESGSESH